jgi:hypothetical protein
MSLSDADRYDGEDAGPDPDAGDESGIAQLDEADLLSQDGYDPLDEGWSPVERPLGLDTWGVTPAEEHAGESLEARLRREEAPRPEEWGDGLGDVGGTDGELRDAEVGDRRAGRLVARDGGDGVEDDSWADDAGIDGAGAGAEEAAVHVIDVETADDDLLPEPG